MNEDNQTKVMSDAVRMMNYKLHAEKLRVPVINGLQVKDAGNPQTILLASGNSFTEQLVSDGYIQDGDFEKRIELVISNTKQFMRQNNCENVDISFIYYKDYSNGIFNYKLYFQDIIMPVNGEKKATRLLTAYFVEPKMHDFYQLSLSAGPFTMPTEYLKVGVIDLQNDEMTALLDNMMKMILDNLKYRD